MIWLLLMEGLSNKTIPEVLFEELGIALIDGLGEKIQSSSWLLEKES